MASAEKAYTADYSYVAPSAYAAEYAGSIPDRDSRGTRTGRKDGAPNRAKTAKNIEVLPETRAKSWISQAVLLRAVVLLIIVGVLLVGTVWMSAKATEIKYSINKTNKEIRLLEDEISTLNIKIESANGIEAVEEYAINELGMRYPKSEQCIYIDGNAKVRDDLASIIKEKAYADS